jgi:hypothetical protein
MWQERIKGDLSEDKVRLLNKYRLVAKQINNRVYWVRQFANKPDHPYLTHRAMKNCHIIELVFSFYDLCVAKMTYFKKHQHLYRPCKVSYRSGMLIACEVWDMEFLVQRSTGIVIDLRNLAAISDIVVFKEMCGWLEQQLEWHQTHQNSPSLWGSNTKNKFIPGNTSTMHIYLTTEEHNALISKTDHFPYDQRQLYFPVNDN